MRATRGAARAYIAVVVAGALCGALPALRSGAGTPWVTVALLTGLYLACELPGRGPFFGSSVPIRAGSFFPLLLAAAFLLPPAAAALVAVPGSLVGRVERPPVTARRVWRAAQLAVTVWAASSVHGLLGGPATLGGTGTGTGTGRLPTSPTRCSPPARRPWPSASSWPRWTAPSWPWPNGSPCGGPGAGCCRARWGRTWCTDWPG